MVKGPWESLVQVIDSFKEALVNVAHLKANYSQLIFCRCLWRPITVGHSEASHRYPSETRTFEARSHSQRCLGCRWRERRPSCWQPLRCLGHWTPYIVSLLRMFNSTLPLGRLWMIRSYGALTDPTCILVLAREYQSLCWLASCGLVEIMFKDFKVSFPSKRCSGDKDQDTNLIELCLAPRLDQRYPPHLRTRR